MRTHSAGTVYFTRLSATSFDQTCIRRFNFLSQKFGLQFFEVKPKITAHNSDNGSVCHFYSYYNSQPLGRYKQTPSSGIDECYSAIKSPVNNLCFKH